MKTVEGIVDLQLEPQVPIEQIQVKFDRQAAGRYGLNVQELSEIIETSLNGQVVSQVREVWDRCINTSDRTRGEVDLAQRFPTPFRTEVLAKAREAGLDPAYMYGLIRQESRFVMDARSSVGASGLMQIMPATARWTARRIGLDYRPEMITDRDVNLRLGTNYLKIVLDDFGGSQAMAAAAYNAGPNRPRRWREGPFTEAAAWAENIPFAETRDYVKKVLSNAVYYSGVLTGQPGTLKGRLGGAIGPRDGAAPAPDGQIP